MTTAFPARLPFRSLAGWVGTSWLVVFAGGEAWTRIAAAGGFSLNAVLSVVLLAMVVVQLVADGRRTGTVRLPSSIWLLTAWFCVKLLGAPDAVVAVQQIVVWLLFVGAILYAATRPAPSGRRAMLRLVEGVSVVWSCIVLVSMVAPGPAWTSRPTAAMLAIGFAVVAARAIVERRRSAVFAAALVLAAVVVGEARTATLAAVAAALFVWGVATFRWRVVAFGRLLGAAVLVAASVGAGLAFTPLGERVAPVVANLGTILADPTGGVARSVTQGRSAVWVGLLERFVEEPLFGYGLGAAAIASHEIAASDRWHHPHNDYLRVAFDAGAIGLVLLLAAVGTWAVRLVREVRRTRTVPAAAALGALLAFALLAVTDNVVVYSYVMIPLGFAIGQVAPVAVGARSGPA